MGYVYRQQYELRFDPNNSGDGLVVNMRWADIDTHLEIRDITGPEMVSRAEANKAMARACEIIAEHLIDWNLETEDKDKKVIPVPVTLAGVRKQSRALLSSILNEWQNAIEEVSAPLRTPSTSGEQSVVARIPMEVLSENPPI